jgi:hypothetical protein
LEFHAEKERELGHAYSEIKGLKVTEALKDKAIAEVILLNELNFRSSLFSFLKGCGSSYHS